MAELSQFRRDKDEFMVRDDNSPLTHGQKAAFKGLNYYEDNPVLRLELELNEDPTKQVVEMQTSTGDVASYIRLGTLSFEINREPAVLTVFKDADGVHLFLPFADATSGDETYGAGRYLDVEPKPGDKVLVDFNYAYNPYCAYNEQWSCPLTPFENRLKAPIRAGEKSFSEDHG